MTTFFVNCDVFSPISDKQASNLALVIPFTLVRYTLNKNNLSKMHAYMKPLSFDFFEKKILPNIGFYHGIIIRASSPKVFSHPTIY
jgi:hypothetical protein